MGKYDFNSQLSMKDTKSWKWDKEGAVCKYPFGVADTDFRPPVEIEDILVKKVTQGNMAYGVLGDEFEECVADWYRKRYGAVIKGEWVRYSPGLITAIKLLMDAVTRQGENIVIMSPVYFNFSLIVNRNGRKLLENTLIYENGNYRIDFDDLEKKASDPRTTMLIFCNPHNPIGRAWSREDLEKVAEICNRNDVFVVSDEAHADIVYHGASHCSFCTLNEETADNSATINSPGKAFNVNGLYASYAIIPNAKIRQAFNHAFENHHFDFSVLGSEALMAAYRYGDCYVDELNEHIAGNAEYLKNFIETNMPEVHMVQPNATYLIWLDFHAWNMNSQQVDEFFRSAGIALNRGDIYGAAGDGFMRFNIACARPVLEEALEELLLCYKKQFHK